MCFTPIALHAALILNKLRNEAQLIGCKEQQEPARHDRHCSRADEENANSEREEIQSALDKPVTLNKGTRP